MSKLQIAHEYEERRTIVVLPSAKEVHIARLETHRYQIFRTDLLSGTFNLEV